MLRKDGSSPDLCSDLCSFSAWEMSLGKMSQAYPSCIFPEIYQFKSIGGHPGLPWTLESHLPEEKVPLNIPSGLQGMFFNVTIVKLHKIMIEGPGTMFPSPGVTQVDVHVPLCPFMFLSISINFCSPVLKCKILEGWLSSIFTTTSPVSGTGRHTNIC